MTGKQSLLNLTLDQPKRLEPAVSDVLVASLADSLLGDVHRIDAVELRIEALVRHPLLVVDVEAHGVLALLAVECHEACAAAHDLGEGAYHLDPDVGDAGSNGTSQLRKLTIAPVELVLGKLLALEELGLVALDEINLALERVEHSVIERLDPAGGSADVSQRRPPLEAGQGPYAPRQAARAHHMGQ